VAQLTNEDFHKLIAEHIEHGNAQAKTSEAGVAGAAMMHAAARYNAYVSSLQCVSGRIMLDRKAAEIEHYMKLYREMLEQHYDEYAANFDQYRSSMIKSS